MSKAYKRGKIVFWTPRYMITSAILIWNYELCTQQK